MVFVCFLPRLLFTKRNITVDQIIDIDPVREEKQFENKPGK